VKGKTTANTKGSKRRKRGRGGPRAEFGANHHPHKFWEFHAPTEQVKGGKTDVILWGGKGVLSGRQIRGGGKDDFSSKSSKNPAGGLKKLNGPKKRALGGHLMGGTESSVIKHRDFPLLVIEETAICARVAGGTSSLGKRESPNCIAKGAFE